MFQFDFIERRYAMFGLELSQDLFRDGLVSVCVVQEYIIQLVAKIKIHFLNISFKY